MMIKFVYVIVKQIYILEIFKLNFYVDINVISICFH